MASADPAVRAAIADVLALYCHAIDRRRWELMRGCFHDDATYKFGPIDGTWRTFVTMARQMIDPLPMTHHQLGHHALIVDGDDARSETYFTATHRVPADAAADAVFAGRGHDYHAVMAGRYVDHFNRRGGRWRIARRVGVIDGRHDIALLPVASSRNPRQVDPASALVFSAD